MNVLSKALGKALNAMRHPGAQPFFMQMLKRTRFDYRKEVGDGLDSSVVTAPVLWIARSMPEAAFAISRTGQGGKVEQLGDHAMLQLLQKPNPFYGDIALWMATCIMFAISGNAYWLIVRNGYGKPVELWFVPNWQIEPKWPQDGSEFISHYRYNPSGGADAIRIDPQDVVHFRYGMDPRNVRLGISPLDGVIREIFVDLESSNFVASLLRNMGVPGVVISPKGGAMPAPEDVEATKHWFKQAFGGDNRGGPLVMGAPTDVQPYGFNPQQLNMSEGRDVAEERVCACLGIPAAVVGFGAGLQQTKVGATMEELRKLAWHNGVLPIARMFADELQRSLLGEFGKPDGLSVGVDTSEVLALQEDEDKQTDRKLKELEKGAITLWDYLTETGREADDSHKYYLRPISVVPVPVAQAGMGHNGGPALEDNPEGGPPKSGSKDDDHAGHDHGPVNGPRASEVDFARGAKFVQILERQENGLASSYEARLVPLFEAWGFAAAEAALPLLEADLSVPKEAKEVRQKADELLVAMILEKLGIAEWASALRQANEAQYLAVANAVQDAAERAGLGASLPDQVARSIVAAGGRRAGLVDLSKQSRKALFDALAEGRAEGEGAQALASRISDHVSGGHWKTAAQRARTIARTETKYAQNISTIERARAAGVGQLIVYDGRLGPGRSLLTHIARNGSIVTIEQGIAMAEAEHPNGTLSFAPYFGT